MDDRNLLHYTEQLDPPEEKFIGECPNCGTPLNWDDEVYINDTDNSVIGCQYCMTRREAGDVFQED